MLKFILFTTGGVQLAIKRQHIAHVQSADSLAVVASSRSGHDAIRFRGNPVPLIDLAEILDKAAPARRSSNAKILVIKGKPAVALWADMINELTEIPESQLDPLPPVFNGPARAYFQYVLRRQGQLMLVLNPESLLDGRCDPSPAAPKSGTQKTHEGVCPSMPAPAQTDPSGSAGREAKKVGAINSRKMEAIILHKMQQYIAERIQAVVAQTLAEALNRQKGRANALLQLKRQAPAAQ